MSQWTSGFAEKALSIPKVWGDVFGLALFGALLGIGRTAYSKFGKNIEKVILWGLVGAFICYMCAGFAVNPAIALIACAFTGIFTSMLWPGSLIYTEEKIPGMSVAAYALMAAGGDLGASVAPQLVGIMSDKVGASSFAQSLGNTLNLTAEQVGMRSGFLIAGLFPLLGVITVLVMKRYFKR
jgi:MFS family permease